MIHQEMKFTYIDVQISSYSEVESEVRQQVVKATGQADQLNDAIFRNKLQKSVFTKQQ